MAFQLLTSCTSLHQLADAESNSRCSEKVQLTRCCLVLPGAASDSQDHLASTILGVCMDVTDSQQSCTCIDLDDIDNEMTMKWTSVSVSKAD